MDNVKHTLKLQILEALNLQDMTPEDLEDDAPLFGDGLGLDSIDSLELMVLLERNYGIKMENAQEGKHVLYSINTMVAYIQKHRQK